MEKSGRGPNSEICENATIQTLCEKEGEDILEKHLMARGQ